ncbi:hypothetical protein PFLA_a2892 [Pseudoalteromonas flavipulchra NCIMB 2033 = ATCC BAA-314]|nr:hypothetical protein [Pseudoalteromonas flavipulchra NCIMB 2033 = ATCC BAA-314]
MLSQPDAKPRYYFSTLVKFVLIFAAGFAKCLSKKCECHECNKLLFLAEH